MSSRRLSHLDFTDFMAVGLLVLKLVIVLQLLLEQLQSVLLLRSCRAFLCFLLLLLLLQEQSMLS